MKFNAVTLMVHGPGQIDDTVCRGEAEYLENVVVGKLCSLRRNCFHFGHGFSRGEAYGFISSDFSGPFEAQTGRTPAADEAETARLRLSKLLFPEIYL
jgi:hypothetical protein